MISKQVEMCIKDATQEEKLVTHSTRETAGRTRDTLAPYATTAKVTALHYADEAKHRLGPALEALGPKVSSAGTQARAQAAHATKAARTHYTKHVAPQLEQAFSALPPQAQQNALKAVHRAQEAALAARHSAGKAADAARTNVAPRVSDAIGGARATIVPAAQEAQNRGAAALAALHGNVSSAEIAEIAARNAKRSARCRRGWTTGLAVAGSLAIGAGVVAWQWWHRQSNPEWLVEPPGSTAGAPTAEPQLNGSGPREQATDQPDGQPTDPTPGPTPGKPAPDDRPKPHDPRKPH
ncbi:MULTISPECIES: DUF5324 family protein [Kitasatospora]|uniref:DUF5324 family protein n=1 Tax=Kitasatospora cystarginea TaxID=58350 RepID=A0ABP5RJB7_9ACTN